MSRMIDDIFCKIIKKEIPAKIVLEGDSWIAIDDISPQAPVHVLIIPKEHFSDIEDLGYGKSGLLGELMLAVDKVAHQKGIAQKGYRIIVNQKENAGQLVPHFHIHLLGGKKLGPKIVQ